MKFVITVEASSLLSSQRTKETKKPALQVFLFLYNSEEVNTAIVYL